MITLALDKFANAKHKGPFYYLARAKKMGIKFQKKSAMDYMKLKKVWKKARMKARNK